MKKPTIGRAESDVLRFVAEKGSASMGEVADFLAETKGQTRSTAINVVERLRKKGFLNRGQVDGVYRYAPAEEKGRLLQGFVEDFVDGVLGGSVSPLVAYLGNRTQVEDEQFEELRQLVRNLEEERRGH